MSSCYILYSPSLDRFYVGSTTLPVEDRLARHNEGYYDLKWSAKGIPWNLFLSIPCETIAQARSIESHIKRMKSRQYYNNLLRYPEIIDVLKSKYSS
jgi:putative endonuclease